MTIFCNLSYFINFVLAQLNFLEEGLLNHAAVGFMESGRSANDLRNLLRKIEESEVYAFRMILDFVDLFNSCGTLYKMGYYSSFFFVTNLLI